MASLVRHSSSLRKVTPEVVSCVQRLLADRQYEMEFHGFLTNHAKHAVIALAGLGASPARIEEYWNSYTSETPYGIRLDPSSTPKVQLSSLLNTCNSKHGTLACIRIL
eukprot:m.25340 g.25340  ORF g.25340 m.25340 type:complete len:108 (+) comp7698_c0_seq1:154-477(+)